MSSSDEFVPPGEIRVSAAALAYLRECRESIAASGYLAFVLGVDWGMTSVSAGRGAAFVDIGDCLVVGTFTRAEIPPASIHTIDGLELVMKIPRAVWENRPERLIDIDETLYFKLALR